jgi:hypothetical protein
MKIIKITESQYKRLVRSNKILSEQVVFKDPKDKKDAHSKMFRILGSVGYLLKTMFNKPLYVLKIEEGVAYIDKSEYQQNEISYIKTEFEKLVRSGISLQDKMLTGSDDLGFDSGVNGDYVWPDEEDNDDVVDLEDNDDVVDLDDTDLEEESECDCINTETNQRYTYNCDDDPPIECFVTDVVVDDDDVVVDYEPNKTYSRTEYINLVKDIAINQMGKHKIPASITIAQAVLESGNGNSDLSRFGKNHFGIKCHGWTGDKSYHDDDRPDECFRNYDKIEDSFEDHSKFLKNNSIYNKLFDLDITDYKGWSKGLKKAGYATASDYANTLISIIEANDLYQYDKGGNNITDCENCINNLTQQQKNNILSNINDNNVNDFRWWVNQDSNILKQVTDKFEECCETKDDPTLNIYGSNNEWVEIAFSVVGNEWINSGKPSKPKEDNVTFFSPSKLGWVPRGNDGTPYGSGDFNASRGDRPHKGFDVKSNVGDDIYSPMDGYVTNVNGCAYNNCSNRNLKKITVVGTGEYSGYKITLLYVKSDLKDGDVVKRGQVIAKQQSLHETYSRKNSNGEFLMTNHVHVHFYENDAVKNANDYNWINN